MNRGAQQSLCGSGPIQLHEIAGALKDLMDRLDGKHGRRHLRGLKRFLRGEIPFPEPIHIRLNTTSLDLSAQLDVLRKHHGVLIEEATEKIVKKIKTMPIRTYHLVIIKSDDFEPEERRTDYIRTEAAMRGWIEPPIQLIDHIGVRYGVRELEEWGIWALILMHTPVGPTNATGEVLGYEICHTDPPGRRLEAFFGADANQWGPGVGFIFIVPEADLCSDPNHYSGYLIETNIKNLQPFDPSSTKVILHQINEQKTDVLASLTDLCVSIPESKRYNANLLDFYLENQRFIPELWKDKTILFFGTIYESSGVDVGELYVRGLEQENGTWHACWYRMTQTARKNYFAAIAA